MRRMKMPVFVWFCAVAVSISLPACHKASLASRDTVTQEFPPGKAPKIFCAEPTYDFGEREEGETLEHQFVIENKGNFPLTIAGVKSSCGCAPAKADKNLVQPGESTTIHIAWKIESRLGKQTKSVVVLSNDPEHEKNGYRFEIGAEVATAIVLEPLVHRLGEIAWDSLIDKTFELKARKDDVTFEVLDTTVELNDATGHMTDASEIIDIDIEEVIPSKHYRLHVVSSAELPQGALNLRAIAKTDYTSTPTYYGTLTGTVIGPVRVDPTVIQVVRRKRQDSASRYRVSLGPGVFKKFKLLEVIPPFEEIKVEVIDSEDSNYTIWLDNLPSEEGIDGKQLRIKIDVLGSEEITIPFDYVDPSKPTA